MTVAALAQEPPAGNPQASRRVLLSETFDAGPDPASLPLGWWCEGSPRVAIRDGWLVQDANPSTAGPANANSVVWIGTELAGDLRFEADVQVRGAQGNVNDVVVFLLFSDPSGTPLFDTRAARASAKQSLYTDGLHGYAFFFWGKGGVTTPANIRLRDCPGAHLLLETNAHSVESGRTYRIAIEKEGSGLRFSVDGLLLASHDAGADGVANPVHSRGLIGLKTWNTELAWDNILVTRPATAR